MWTIITQEVLRKFKVRLMSTGRSGSNHDSKQKWCSCRFFSEVTSPGVVGIWTPWSQLGPFLVPFLVPLTAHTWAWMGLIIPNRWGNSPAGSKIGSYRWRKMLLPLVTANLCNGLCLFFFSSVCCFCFPAAFPTINSQSSFILSSCISVFAHMCYHRTSHQ